MKKKRNAGVKRRKKTEEEDKKRIYRETRKEGRTKRGISRDAFYFREAWCTTLPRGPLPPIYCHTS